MDVKSDYKSNWRPLIRENDDTSPNNTPLVVETLKKKDEKVGKLAGGNEPSNRVGILENLDKISTNINTLYQMISNLSDKVDRLYGLLEEKGAKGKKSST